MFIDVFLLFTSRLDAQTIPPLHDTYTRLLRTPHDLNNTTRKDAQIGSNYEPLPRPITTRLNACFDFCCLLAIYRTCTVSRFMFYFDHRLHASSVLYKELFSDLFAVYILLRLLGPGFTGIGLEFLLIDMITGWIWIWIWITYIHGIHAINDMIKNG